MLLFTVLSLYGIFCFGESTTYGGHRWGGYYPSHSTNGWTNVGDSRIRLTDTPLSWGDAAKECARLGGVLFDPGQSDQLLYDVANRLSGDGQMWVNMRYVPDGHNYEGLQGPGWYWMNSKRKVSSSVSRYSRYCTSGALSKSGSSVVTVGEEPWNKNYGLCLIEGASSTTANSGIGLVTAAPITQQPGVNTQQPGVNTQQPGVNTQQPGAVTNQPVVTRSIPASVTSTVAPGSTTPCSSRRVTAVIPQNQNGVEVQVAPGVSVTLTSPGTFEYKNNGCSVIIDVIKQSPFACTNSPVTLSTAANNLAPFTLMVNGVKNTVQLPVGRYNYSTQAPSGGSCQIEIQVVDGNVIRRLDVVAQYNANCNDTSAGQNKQIIELFAQKSYGQMNAVTNGKVNENSQYPVTSDCQHNVLTVRWPTDTVYPSNVTSLPRQVYDDIQPALKQNPDIFQLIVPNGTPPVISPRLDINGSPAALTLESTCKGLQQYDPATDSCK